MSGLPNFSVGLGALGELQDAAERDDTVGEAAREFESENESGDILGTIGAGLGATAEQATQATRFGGEFLLDEATGGESEETVESAFRTADQALWENTPLDPEAELAGPIPGTVGDVGRLFVGEPVDAIARAGTGTRPYNIQEEEGEPFSGFEALDLAFTALPGGLLSRGASAGGRALDGISGILRGSSDEAAQAAGTTMSGGLLRGASRALDEDVASSIARMDFDEFSSVSTRSGVDDTFTRGTETAREFNFDSLGGVGRVMDELPNARQTGTDLGSVRAGDGALSRGGESAGGSFDEMLSNVDGTIGGTSRGFGNALDDAGRTVDDVFDSTNRTLGETFDDVAAATGRSGDEAGTLGRLGDDTADEVAASGTRAASGADEAAAAGRAGRSADAAENVGTLGRVTNSIRRGFSRATSAIGRILRNPLTILGLGGLGFLGASSLIDGELPDTVSDGPYVYEQVATPTHQREGGRRIVGVIFRIRQNGEELGYTVFINESRVLTAGGQTRTASISLNDLAALGGTVESDNPQYTPLEPVFNTLSEARRVFTEWAKGNTAPDQNFQQDDPNNPGAGDDDSQQQGSWGNAEIVRELGAGWYLARQRHTETEETRWAVIGRTDGGDDVYLNSRGRASKQPSTFEEREAAIQAFQKWAERARNGQTGNEPRPSPNAGRPSDSDVQEGMGSGGGTLSRVTQAASENPRLLLYGGAALFGIIYYISDGEPIKWIKNALPYIGE